MPALIDTSNIAPAVQQVILSSDADYIDQLIPVLKDVRHADRAEQLIQALDQIAAEKEAEIESMCNSNHQDFVNSVNQLLKVREGSTQLTAEILEMNQSISASMEKLATKKRDLVQSRDVRQNIDDTTQALQDCLQVLRLANQVHDLLAKKNYYAALRALEELQTVHLRAIRKYKISEMIEKSVPETQRLIAEAVMNDLNTWLYRIRETSQFLGEFAFYQTQMRRQRQRDRAEKDALLGNFKLNSAVELVADETEEFDVLNNEEVTVDFSPLFECIHIHEALGRKDWFRAEYSATRKQQKELLLPNTLSLADDDVSELNSLLESAAGFAIVEKETMKKTINLRSPVDVDDLWNSMCQSALSLISDALHAVNNDEKLLKVKGVIALFMQTMQSWGYPVKALDSLLLTLFDKYAQVLRNKFSDDFQEIVSTDDYMPMQIRTIEEYNNVINVSWYTPTNNVDPSRLTFPTVLPFSQMYPLCCIDIRNFLNQIYLFADDNFQQSSLIDETLKNSLDELLCQKVCQSLVERLSSQYPGQIVQILTNLEHFEVACVELQELLKEARTSTAATGPIVLAATEQFRTGKKTAEKRIFELVNSKIDDLIETAEYDWDATASSTEPSDYMTQLVNYLTHLMKSVLLGLPTEIRELIYFDALSHAAGTILSLPLDPSVKQITPAAARRLSIDTAYLVGFVDSLNNPILKECLDELMQTVALMQTENPDEYYDVSQRNKKYGRVDKMNGPVLLEKYIPPARYYTSYIPTLKRKGNAMSLQELGTFN